MADNEIRIIITADASQANAQIRSMAGETVSDFDRMQAAQSAYDKAAKGSVATQMALAAEFDKSTAAGLSFTESMERAVAATTAVTSASGRAAVGVKTFGANANVLSNEMRVLEGSTMGAARVMGTFLAGIPGVGTALQSAFSLFAIAAFAEIAVQAGKALYEAFDVSGERARKTAEEIRGVDYAFRTLNDSTSLELDKLNDANAKLEHKPNPNAAKMAMDEALVSADKMDQKLDGLLKKEESVLKGMEGTWEQKATGFGGGTGYENTLLTEHQKHLEDQKDIEGQLAESKSYFISLLARQKELQDQLAHPSLGFNNAAQQQVDLNATNELIRAQQNEQRAIQTTIDLQKAQETHTGLEGDHAAKTPKVKDDTMHLFIQGEIADYRTMEEESKRVTAAITATWVEGAKADEESQKRIDEQVKRSAEEYRRYHEEVERGAQIQIEAASAVSIAAVRTREESGAITKVTADRQLGAIQAKEYADRIKELSDQLVFLNSKSADYVKIQNEINKLQGQAKVSGTQDSAKVTQDMAAPYINASDMINQNWLQMQNKLISGTKNISQAFANMGVSMLESVAASFEKMLLKQLQMEIRSMIAHQAANAAKVTSDATATAAGDAIKEKSALKEAFHNAKVAATGAFKSVMSAVPPPANFILAPIAAGAAFAGVMAVGAFETGGIIPETGISYMHKGEAALPRNLTNMLMSVANSNSTSNSSLTMNSSANYQGITDRNFRDMARRHSDAVADAVGREVRGGRRM